MARRRILGEDSSIASSRGLASESPVDRRCGAQRTMLRRRLMARTQWGTRWTDDGTILKGRHDRDRATNANSPELEKALALFGPLEARIMRAIWTHAVEEPFVGRQAQSVIPTRAYTTVMTTLNRLVGKEVLQVEHIRGRRGQLYRAKGPPGDYLLAAGSAQADQMVARFGDAALAALAARVSRLSPAELRRIRKLRQFLLPRIVRSSRR